MRDKKPLKNNPKGPRPLGKNGKGKHPSKPTKSDKIRERLRNMKKYASGEKCTACQTYLGLQGGYKNTGKCGVCATGNPDMELEFCIEW